MNSQRNSSTRTKIIATVGPASESPEILRDLVREGVSGFRLNFSHGNSQYFEKIIKNIRELEKELDIPLTIMGDLQGPTIRLGSIDKFLVKKGDKLRIELSDSTKERNVIPIPEEEVFKIVDEGDVILIDDGKVEVEVLSKHDTYLVGKVIRGGEVRAKVTVAVRGKEIDLPVLDEKDKDYIEFTVQQDLDILAVSFVKKPDDLREVRNILKRLGGDGIRIYSKIETISAINNLDEIVKYSDGVLIARGDLGSYYPLETIPKLQALVVERCLYYGKPSILATQILESMITHPIPTRAEITDIFMGVMEGVDAMLLSGETAIGNYPVESVVWLRKAISEAESFYAPRRLDSYEESVYDKFVKGIVFLAEEMGAKIIAYTKEGQTARRISRYRPKIEVFAFTNDRGVVRHINLLYGIKPYLVTEEDIREAIEAGKRKLLLLDILRKGDIIIKTAGLRRMTTDRIEVEEIK